MQRIQIWKDKVRPTSIKDVYNKIADGGDIWGDGHINNMMFQPDGRGGLTAIIHDADMIMTGPELQQALGQFGNIPAAVVQTALEKVSLQGILSRPFTARAVMDALHRSRFGGNLIDGGSGTVPR
jgi:hypothetical protein